MKIPKLHWPKPSPVPFSSLSLLIVNVTGTYSVQAFGGNIWWLLPIWAMNIFFFWAERDIYVRQRRNYDGWHAEMRAILDNPIARRKAVWANGLEQVKRRRRSGGKKYNDKMSEQLTA